MFSNLALIENKLCLNDVYALSLFFSFSLFFVLFFTLTMVLNRTTQKKRTQIMGKARGS